MRSSITKACHMSEPSSAHCLSDMWLANDSMMSRRSSWLRERRFGNLETFKEKKNTTEKTKKLKPSPNHSWCITDLPLPPHVKQAGQASQRLGMYGVKSQSWSWAAEDGPRGLQSWLPALITQFQTAAWRGWEWRTAEMLTPALPLWERSVITVYIDNSTANGCQLSTLLKAKLGTIPALNLKSVCFYWEHDLGPDLFTPVCS